MPNLLNRMSLVPRSLLRRTNLGIVGNEVCEDVQETVLTFEWGKRRSKSHMRSIKKSQKMIVMKHWYGKERHVLRTPGNF